MRFRGMKVPGIEADKASCFFDSIAEVELVRADERRTPEPMPKSFDSTASR